MGNSSVFGKGEGSGVVDVNVCLFLLDTSSQGLRLPFVLRFGFSSPINCPSRSGHLAVWCWVIEIFYQLGAL
jgi:hypothetical protein